ncbi:hypothetical protein ACVK1X_004375 [Pseudomonas sp. PvR086]
MSNEEKLIHRDNTKIIKLCEITQAFSNPECLRLQLSAKIRRKPLDIGSLAYHTRGKNKNIHADSGTPVLLSSFVKGRRELIVRLLESFSTMRERTVLGYFSRAEYFVDWLNDNGHKELFSSEVQAQEAYIKFVAHLHHRIHMQEIGPFTAVGYQSGAVNVIRLLYPESCHRIVSGVARIIGQSGTLSPREAHIKIYKDVLLAIAQQCSDFVLSNKPFPCVLNVQTYEVVIFPSNNGVVGPFKKGAPIYNAKERRIATIEEYMEAAVELGRKGVTKSDATRTIRNSISNLTAANEDERNRYRASMATLAAKAYAGLFLMITGASPTEFAQFSYEDALGVEVSPLRKELSAVKFRAAGKKTFYNIGRGSGLQLLKAYLKLREWILDGDSFDKLFFLKSEVSPSEDMKPFGDFPATAAMQKFYSYISGIFLDPEIPFISARKMRKHKSMTLHFAGVSPSAVAASMNHTESVNLSTYAETTPERQEAEFSRFWQSVRHAATIVRERSQKVSGDAVSIGAGHCEGFNQPSSEIDSELIAIEPNCRTQYGCLYCLHYVCHSDEEDLHKLMSLQFVINSIRRAAPDLAHAEVLYKDLSIRIEFIIDALGKRSESIKKVVERVRLDVFEYGKLTPFWERRLSRYEKIGVVF